MSDPAKMREYIGWGGYFPTPSERPTERPAPPKCECGVDPPDGGLHSEWCPKYEK